MEAAVDPEDKGRSTDSVLGHLTVGEVVIPREFLESPDVRSILEKMFEEAGADIAEFTVGNKANKINPETGYPEFFFKKIFKAAGKIFSGAAKAFGLGPPKMPPPPKPVEMPKTPVVEQSTIDRENTDRLRQRRGRAANVLTGASGAVGAGSVAKKNLLGQ
jgi:hypothetical protein